jgi:hypothetical protein
MDKKPFRRQQELVERIEHELHQFNSGALDEHQAQTILERIQREINSIPKLSYKQFRTLSQEQKDEYIKLLERLASQCAILVKYRQKNVPLTQFANNHNAHFTLMALQMVQEREQEKYRQKLEKVRQEIIKHKKYYVSVPRLLHRLKRSRIEDRHKREILEFIDSSPLLSKYNRLNHSSKFITDLAVVYKDLLELWKLTKYAIEECLLYVIMFPIDITSFRQLDRVIEDNDFKQQRQRLEYEKQQVEDYNKALALKWKTLSSLQRIEYYIRPQVKHDFERIIERAKSLGLNDDKIIELLLSEQENSELFIPDFNKDYNVIPVKKISPELEFGIHTFTLELARRLNVPEKVFKKFSQNELNHLKDSPNDLAILTQKLNLDQVENFIKYWNEIMLLEDDYKSVDQQQNPSSKL